MRGEQKTFELMNTLIERIEKLVRPLFDYEVIGTENITEIKSNQKIILATTHITNSDVAIVLSSLKEVAKKYPRFGHTKVVQEMTNFIRFPHFLFIHYLGKDNSISLSTNGFKPKEYQIMKKHLGEGYPILHAAYLDKKSDGHTLSDKAGIGVVYLAADDVENTVIVPVSVSINIKLPMHGPKLKEIIILFKTLLRPKAIVKFGKPYKINEIENYEIVEKVYDKRRKSINLTNYENETYNQVKENVVNQSNELMRKLAELLPKEKRGNWQIKKKVFGNVDGK